MDIKALVNRFLSWPLPGTVCTDLCTTIPDLPNVNLPNVPKRIGTNLLTANEAEQMFEYVLDGVEEHSPGVAAIAYALEADDGLQFLQLWYEGEFNTIREEWPDCPQECFIGAEVGYVRK